MFSFLHERPSRESYLQMSLYGCLSSLKKPRNMVFILINANFWTLHVLCVNRKKKSVNAPSLLIQGEFFIILLEIHMKATRSNALAFPAKFL